MRELPPEFMSVIHDGVAALHWLSRVLEERIRSRRGSDAILLELRDVTGLAGRLESATSQDWEEGWMLTALSPQDLAVLEKWERESSMLPDAAGRSRQLRRLRELLADYME